jgi:hypothetical protein
MFRGFLFSSRDRGGWLGSASLSVPYPKQYHATSAGNKQFLDGDISDFTRINIFTLPIPSVESANYFVASLPPPVAAS